MNDNAFSTISEIQRNVISEVIAERKRQDKEWGADKNHHPLEWDAIIGEEKGEVSKGALEAHFTGYEISDDWTPKS